MSGLASGRCVLDRHIPDVHSAQRCDDRYVMGTAEFDFELPNGYRDPKGRVHKSGTMRLATARDELLPLLDPRVKETLRTCRLPFSLGSSFGLGKLKVRQGWALK